MGIFMYYAVPAIVGALISIFMDKIAVHYIKVVLRSERMLESLENMVNTLNTVSQNSLHIREKCGTSLIHGWNKRLQELVGEASRRVGEHRLVREQRGFSRVHYKLNILSRYQRSKEIANLISDISKHLKLVPVVQLECVLSLISNKRRPPTVLGGGLPVDNFTAGIVGWAITAAFLEIFFYMGRLRNFKKKLASFRDLMNKIDPFVKFSRDKMSWIRRQLKRANKPDNWLTHGRNWVDEMNAIIKEGQGINDSWSPIARCKKSEQITELTSRIDAHLNKLSWITLDLLFHVFHEIEGPTGPPLMFHEIMSLSTSAQETLTPRRPSTASQETEGSTRDAVPSCETEGSTSHPTEPLQGVCITVV